MFQSYQEGEIESILKGKVEGHSIVDPKAITFIAKKVSNVKGDARQAIEMLSTALSNAREKAQENPGAKKNGPYLVGMKDVIRLGSDHLKLTDQIKDLPLYGRLVVSAAVKLAVKNHSSGSTVQLTREDLLITSCRVIQDKFPSMYVDEADVNSLINALHDSGLATIETTFGVGLSDPITFNHLATELDAAVDEALEGAFYDIDLPEEDYY